MLRRIDFRFKLDRRFYLIGGAVIFIGDRLDLISRIVKFRYDRRRHPFARNHRTANPSMRI
jgi:hypothetical protein